VARSPALRTPVDRVGYALLFLALFVPYSYFNHSDGWNQAARLAELHAIVIHGTLQIDAYHTITGDKAHLNGHYYSEKAPTVVYAALPVFALTVLGQRLAGVDPDGPEGWRVSAWITTAACVGLITALGGLAFFALIDGRLGGLVAVLATFGLFLGTLTFPYATSLFAHGATIGLLAIALWAVLGPQSNRRDYVAGLTAGLAVASEYPAVLTCGVIGLYLMYVSRPRMWRFAVATVPALVLILLNNYLISGSPFSLSYGANPAFPEMTTGNLMGFTLPDLALTPALLLGEYRGLLFWSPILVLAIPGFVVLFRTERPVAIMLAMGFLLIFLQVAAFYNWYGGNSFGPRYLAAALPFIGVATAYGIKRFTEMGLVLTVISIAMIGMVTAIAIDPPADVLTPLESFYWARIQQDRLADNLGSLLGLPVWVSLVVPLVLPAVAVWRLAKEPERHA
jgi:MFS family permease